MKYIALLAALLLSNVAVAAPDAATTCEQLAGHPWEPGSNGAGVEWGLVEVIPAIAACRAALAAAPDSVELAYRLGRTLMQDRQYEEAFALLLRSAEAGYSPAEVAYGTAYMQADGVGFDAETALEWLSRASAHGHPIAHNNLAIMYMEGAGVPKDFGKAAELLARAADANYPNAMHNLGVMFDDGMLGARDHERTFEWFAKAAELGYLPAQWAVARAYGAGRGVPADAQRAFVEWLKPATAGDYYSQLRVGLLYLQGKGSQRIPERRRLGFAAAPSSISRRPSWNLGDF